MKRLIFPLILLGLLALGVIIGSFDNHGGGNQHVANQTSAIQVTPLDDAKIRQRIKAAAQNTKPQNITRNLIIFYDKTIGKTALLQAVQDYDAELLYDYKNLHGIAIKLPNEKDVDEAIGFFKKVDGVLSVERDSIMQLHQTQ